MTPESPPIEDLTPTFCPRCGKPMRQDAYNKMYKVCRTCYTTDPDIQKQKAETKVRIMREIDEKFRSEMGDEAFEAMKTQEARGQRSSIPACEQPAVYQCRKCSAKAGRPVLHKRGSSIYQKHIGYKV